MFLKTLITGFKQTYFIRMEVKETINWEVLVNYIETKEFSKVFWYEKNGDLMVTHLILT